ncbi:O-antigen ligase family protein [Pontimicrobium sp. SW4]|uniref:O-antigen ligase family protein n=1 Tax=Pontimicrobium sp. SW4 TaxID=3153519 RepID=A0AAU7BSI1_9FLAO
MINSNINKFTINKILKYFYLSSVLSTAILIGYAIIKIIKASELSTIIFHGFTGLYDQHPVYFSMYLSLSLFISASFDRDARSKKIFTPKFIYLFNSILLVGLILCASKAVLAFNFIAFSVFYLLKIRKTKTRIKYIITFVVTGFLIFNIPFIKDRFVEGISFSKEIALFKPTNDYIKKKVFTYDEKEAISDLELRYICGSIGLYHLIKDNKVYFGYGQGDTKNYLNYYYFSYNLGPNWFENRNVHNQYLHFLIMYGIFVLTFFLAYLFYSFRKAINNKNRLHLFFLLLTSFVFIFEVVLVRNKGIIFFYFFNSLFLFNYDTIEDSNIRN